MIRFSKCASQTVTGAIGGLGIQERIDCFDKAPGKQMLVSGKRNQTGLCPAQSLGQMVTIDRRQKEKRAYSMIEIGFVTSEFIECLGMSEQLIDGCITADRLERLIACLIVF